MNVSRPPGTARERIGFRQGSEFSALSPVVASRLSQIGSVRLYGPNEFIYLQDDAADHLYFVRSGHVRLSYLLEDGSAVLFAILPPGDSFGELGVFAGGTHHDMATTVGTSSVFRVPAAELRDLDAQGGEMALALGRTVARRYRSYIALTRSLGLKTLNGRLSQALLRLCDDLGSTVPFEGRQVPMVGAFVTQSDLGMMARGARSNVNRALKSWERSGWIAVRDRAILIVNRPRLEALWLEEGL
ncbi:Crp/Fnr family transcriptional regulator [Aureimonas jatrophae]|uniref:cAMP-binding domain of CRP or a regulatory subunit of cAMP-dependent protein kinases n=1 Tax=Aureimonas jatrophae TaxID=1166073 RepID=A0A1H0EUD1_9HYPH|nr:Crp/Fnr family transcriptional regulator [Aureimonas jatrophae]MBB3950309.1 CRP-like cAMP-binding protein [Aureimonas jatrophae]SDN85988.1 cAMP-binding domain of CRP or a regulatory subunit of cAMP-dependent protein kinases [Aureimonas jatrophae]